MSARYPRLLRVVSTGFLATLAACSDGTDTSRSPATPDPEPPPNTTEPG